MGLLADDDIGAGRESPDDLAPYRKAFAAIDADTSESLVVAERDGAVVGTEPGHPAGRRDVGGARRPRGGGNGQLLIGHGAPMIAASFSSRERSEN